MNNKEELLSILEGLSPEKIALLKRELYSEEKTKTKKKWSPRCGQVKTIYNIKVIVTCSTCGSKQELNRTASKEEEECFKPSEKLSYKEIHKKASHCPYCKDFIKTLSREALEERYLSLLKHAYFI